MSQFYIDPNANASATNCPVYSIGFAANADSPYAVPDDECYIACDTSDGLLTVTLPDAADHTGRQIIIKDVGGNTNAYAITVATAGGDLQGFGGSVSTKTIVELYAGAICVSDGTNWGYFYIS